MKLTWGLKEIVLATELGLRKMTGDEKLTVISHDGKLLAHTTVDPKSIKEQLADLASALNEKDRFSVDYDDAPPPHTSKTGKPLSEKELDFVRYFFHQILEIDDKLPAGIESFTLNVQDNYWYRFGYNEMTEAPFDNSFVLQDMKEVICKDNIVIAQEKRQSK